MASNFVFYVEKSLALLYLFDYLFLGSIMDLLSDFLKVLQFKSNLLLQAQLAETGGLKVPGGFSSASSESAKLLDSIPFHIVTEGKAYLHLKREKVPVEVSKGDIVLFPRGDEHLICASTKPGYPSFLCPRVFPEDPLMLGEGPFR